MKKISTSIALAVLLGAASTSTPADAFSFKDLGKTASKVFSHGVNLAKQVVTSKEFQDGAKQVVTVGAGIATSYIQSQVAGGGEE